MIINFLRSGRALLLLSICILTVTFANSSLVLASGTWENVGSAGFSADLVNYTSIAFDSNDIPYMAYSDEGNDDKVTVMKYDEGSWSLVGSAGFSTGEAVDVKLVFDSNDVPYVAYEDRGIGNKVSVMKYNGSAWELVGDDGFSVGEMTYLSFAIDSNDIPYVVYHDYENGHKATAMKYNGSAWELVGPGGFTAGVAAFISLAFDSNDVPYISYGDSAQSSKATVMKYNGTSWELVGTAGFSSSQANSTTIVLDSNDIPYVAYQDFSTGRKATVMKYDEGSWGLVGSAGFTATQANSPSLALDSNDAPYVAYYRDNIGNANVMKYNGTTWELVGPANFSVNAAAWLSFAINSSDVPHVGYRDSGSGRRATVMKYVPPVTYELSFDEQGGSSVSDQSDLEEDEEATLPVPPTRSGYTFQNWNTVADGSGTEYDAEALYTMPASNTTLYAIWEETELPTVVTSEATNITTESARFNGEVTDLGNVSITSWGFNYGLTSEYGDTITIGGGIFEISPFYSEVSELDCIEEYHYQAFVNTDSEIVTGDDVVFATCLATESSSSRRQGTSIQSRVKSLEKTGNTERAEELKEEFSHLFETTDTDTTSTGSVSVRDLELTLTGPDVKALQQLLNAQGYLLAETGVGSIGNETEYFGTLTQNALARYQAANGIVPSVGYFGPITRAQMKSAGLAGLWW